MSNTESNSDDQDRKAIIAWLEDSLSDSERRHIKIRLEQDDIFAGKARSLQAAAGVLRDSAPDEFAPFFSRRVSKRISEMSSPATSFAEALRGFFPRLAIVCAAVAIGLGVLNLITYSHPFLEGSLIDALFSLPKPTLDNALYLASG